ncbi:hypothetical protein ACQBAU_00320 [Propionibacteriaceae bacterium Y2011]|uniref:hypothetical protein n=1 Tax=Microlunatus sp. Y2014 TaxID=3418488 RepID=UPI003B45A3A5
MSDYWTHTTYRLEHGQLVDRATEARLAKQIAAERRARRRAERQARRAARRVPGTTPVVPATSDRRGARSAVTRPVGGAA